MKKVLVAVLTALVLMSFFAACTKTNPTSIDVTVVVTATATTVVFAPTATPGVWDDNYPSADANGNIYFASNNGLSGSGIYSVKADGTGLHKIEAGAAYRGLEVTEDGNFLFVRSNAATVKRIISSNGNPQSTYTLTSSTDIAGYGASWISNTAKVLYNSTYGAYTGLTVEDTTGSAPTNLTPGLLQNTGAICSNPFGKYETAGIVVYEYYDGSNWHIIKETNASTFTDITPGSSAKRYPAWSITALNIIYCDNTDGDYDVYVMNDNGTGKIKLFDTTANESYPRYVPGTNKILFVSDVSGNNKLYTIDATGNTNTIVKISQ